MSLLANSYSFLLPANTITATSARHSTASSKAFLKSPFLRLRNVTYSRLAMARKHDSYSSIAVILDGTNLDFLSAHGITIAIAW
jgi:hypothetical protein